MENQPDTKQINFRNTAKKFKNNNDINQNNPTNVNAFYNLEFLFNKSKISNSKILSLLNKQNLQSRNKSNK